MTEIGPWNGFFMQISPSYTCYFEGFRRPGEPSGANDWNVFVCGSYYF